MAVCKCYFLEKAVLNMFIKQCQCPWCSHRGKIPICVLICSEIESDITNQHHLGAFAGGGGTMNKHNHTQVILE